MNQTHDGAESLGRGVRSWSMVVGIVMVVLGIVAITLSVAATYATMLFLGMVIAIRGIFELLYALRLYHHEGFYRLLFGGVLSVVVGLLLLSSPGLSAAALTLFIAAFMVVGGLFRSIAVPLEHGPHWAIELVAAVVTLLLGLWLLSGWPTTALWFIGLLLGIEILVTGVALTMSSMVLAPAAGGHTQPSGGR